ncbi:DUF2194 domain-containing protein [Paenibacillus harenae]|uniref:DUF2194 domain-containing protein n=1 Tax=Paenibacillus harenae TaxID=306543 RepID=UPI00041EF5E6|nr:DUF2194 domain-containing protein [Paenibacillus harenae]
MKKELNFSRNIYIILIVILSFGILTQVARSQYVLQFKHNRNLVEQRDELFANIKAHPPEELTGTNYCIAYTGADNYSNRLKENAARTLQYMGKKSTEFDLDKQGLNLNDCGVLLVAVDQLNQIGDVNDFDRYVRGGGYVFMMSSLFIDTHFQVLYRKFGITSFGDLNDIRGIKLTSNVLIGESKLKIDDDFMINYSASVDLDEKSQLLAQSAEGIPILWKREYGDGAFVLFNGTMLQEKVNRGLLAGALSLLEPDFIYPIINSKIFFIDDFPAPVTKEIIPSIYREYRRDVPAFYKDVWWPDMLKAAKKYDIKYTAAIIQSYNDDVSGPFEHPVDEDRYGLIAYGREVIKSGGEIGIHGYNHQSLVSDEAISKAFGYNSWKNSAVMEESIEEVLSYAGEAFPKYAFLSYVPPSNVLGADGREALKKAWPHLSVISSLYLEDVTNMSYVQEYEIADDGVIEMPRITSGYFEDVFERWAEANAMTGLGLFSHFIHPDDILSSARSKNQNWGKLYENFVQKAERFQETYPWVRSMTSTEAALDMAGSLTAQVKWTQEENRIQGDISNYRDPLYFILRSDKKIGRLTHCSVKKIDANTYLVEAHDSKFTIELGGS